MAIAGRLEHLTVDEVSTEIETLDMQHKEDLGQTAKKYQSTRKLLTALLRVLQEED